MYRKCLCFVLNVLNISKARALKKHKGHPDVRLNILDGLYVLKCAASFSQYTFIHSGNFMHKPARKHF